ncbi:hypothetical protein M0802_014779 [Mischocyttarus mexicanus]|nr:hypothetical protein M0802_014779 [Mischocyttarus mexicanus]
MHFNYIDSRRSVCTVKKPKPRPTLQAYYGKLEECWSISCDGKRLDDCVDFLPEEFVVVVPHARMSNILLVVVVDGGSGGCGGSGGSGAKITRHLCFHPRTVINLAAFDYVAFVIRNNGVRDFPLITLVLRPSKEESFQKASLNSAIVE